MDDFDFFNVRDEGIIFALPREAVFEYNWFLSFFEHEKRLGQGGFGHVDLIRSKINGEYIAKKTMHGSIYHRQNKQISGFVES